jgi:hypothetical protein
MRLDKDRLNKKQKRTKKVLINCWHEFLQTPYGQSNVPDWFDKLQAVIQSQEAEDEPSEQQETTREEWMILSDLNTPFDNSEQTPESTYDWHLDRANYSEQQIQEMPTWIKKTKRNTLLMSNMMLLTSTVLVKCKNLLMILLSLIFMIHHPKKSHYVSL